MRIPFMRGKDVDRFVWLKKDAEMGVCKGEEGVNVGWVELGEEIVEVVGVWFVEEWNGVVFGLSEIDDIEW